MKSDLKILRLKGQDILPFIPELARLRIEIFKSYPYLYDGNFDYERKYLNTYVECKESIMVIALDGDKVVGASSGIPLEFETIEFKKPFLENKINIQDVFYFGESVLQVKYRGCGIYRHFFKEREAAAKEYNAKIAAFASIEKPLDDPNKPNDYIPLDSVWRHFGYEKHSELRMHYKWKTIGETFETPKLLIFWLKQL